MADIDTPSAGTISRAPPTDPGANYLLLLHEGTRLVQQLSGKIWTDYNFSDPGVTILEQLCYALTELTYRADFPVAELLGAPEDGRIALQRQGLYPARSIMPVSPVTIDDLRRLIIDRVHHVGNAWFTKIPPDPKTGVNGLYRVDILVPEIDPGCADHGPDTDKLREDILDCYTAHRALCEDVHEVRFLQPRATKVHAAVQLDSDSDPDSVLARLYFALGLELAPEPRRAGLDALREAGKTTAEIFTGPLMLRGFITDDQLTPLPATIAVDNIQATIAELAGVLAVDTLEVHVVGDHTHYIPGDTITVEEGEILWIDSAARGGHFSITLLHGSTVCKPNAVRVRRLLDRLWTAQRRTYALWADYAADYKPPRGRGGDLAAYSSIQNQFPHVYGIGSYGLPSEAGPKRRGQAKQLKGYLMVFDQLMANYFSQLAFIRDLFSVKTGGDHTYAWQSLRPIVPDVEPLLSLGYDIGLQTLIATGDPVQQRQNAVLDFLLSLYAETLDMPADTDCGKGSGVPAPSGSALVKAKQALLAAMVPATRDRGRGFNYRGTTDLTAMVGLEIRCRIELALLDSRRHHRPDVVDDPADATFGRPLSPVETSFVERRFLPVETVNRTGEEEWAPHGSSLAGQRVAVSLLAALPDPRRYRVGSLPDTGKVDLVCQAIDDGWWLVAECRDVAEAVAITEKLVAATGEERQQLYIVEWILLRDALHHRHQGGSGQDLPPDFSFRVSAILPTAEAPENDHGWRQSARRILRENMPAHIVDETLFLGPRRMRHFLRLYDHWLAAMRSGSERRRAETSWHLARFLDHRDQAEMPAPIAAPLPPAPPPPPPAPEQAEAEEADILELDDPVPPPAVDDGMSEQPDDGAAIASTDQIATVDSPPDDPPPDAEMPLPAEEAASTPSESLHGFGGALRRLFRRTPRES